MKTRSGEYYVWHCDWCDSTNYTIWTQMASEGLVCGACHHQAGNTVEEYPVFMQANMAAASGVYA